jgi:hypothetical protein
MSTGLLAVVEEHSSDPALHPYVVGGIALGLLIAMLLFTLAFGKGRPHS